MVSAELDESLWSWNGSRWSEVPQLSRNGPPLMTTNSMLSIDASGHVVLFGGVTQFGGTQNFDTWVWNGLHWRNVVTAATPAPTRIPPPRTQDPSITTPVPLPTASGS